MPLTPLYEIPYQTLSDPPNGAQLGQDIAEAVERELTSVWGDISTTESRVTTLETGPNVSGWTHFSVGETTSSTAYANLGAGSSVSFVKRKAATRLMVAMVAQFQSASTGRGVEFGVHIGSTDYLVAPYHQVLPAANARLTASGHCFISSIAAGTFTIQGRWKAVGGSGTVTRFNGDDWISCTITEVT